MYKKLREFQSMRISKISDIRELPPPAGTPSTAGTRIKAKHYSTKK